jgi:hypothetical protein
MASIGRKYRTIYLVTAALMVALVGGYALAATSLTNGPNQGSNVTTSPTSAFAQGTVTSEQLVLMTNAMVGLGTTGTNPIAVGLGGTPTALTACAASPCAAQSFRPFSQNAITPTLADYAEQIVLSVTQPTAGTGASAFDFSITISITVGIVTSNVVYQGYISTGTTSAGSAMTIPVFLFLDFGTTTAPVVNSPISMVFNQCSLATACP